MMTNAQNTRWTVAFNFTHIRFNIGMISWFFNPTANQPLILLDLKEQIKQRMASQEGNK